MGLIVSASIYFLSVVGCIIYSCYSRSAWRKGKYMTPTYLVFGAATLVSVFALFLFETVISACSCTSKCVLVCIVNSIINTFICIVNALINTFRVFGIEESMTTWIIELQPSVGDVGLNALINSSRILSLYISILCISAPLMTFYAAYKLFRSKIAVFLCGFHRFKKTYIFSEMNERSVTLADSIAKQAGSTKKVFVSKPIIIFTDVTNNNDEQNGELYERIKYMNPIVTRTSAEAFVRVTRRNTQTYVFCIGSDEFINAGRAIKMRADNSFLTYKAENKSKTKKDDDKPETKTADDKPETKTADDKPETKAADDKPETKTADDKPETKTADDKLETKTADDKPETKTADDKLETKKDDDKPKTKKVGKESKRNHLYAFCVSDAAKLIIESANDDPMNERDKNERDKNERYKIELFNEDEYLVYDLLFRHPLFEPSYETKSREMNILVIGAGNVGAQFAKAALWCGQMNTYSLKVTVCDERQNLVTLFEGATPELGESIKRFSPGTVLEYEAGVDAVSSEFELMLSRHSDATYVLVALGNDALTAETAKRARTFFERQKLFGREKTVADDSLYNPFIVAVVRDNTMNKTLKASEESQLKGTSRIVYYGSNDDIFNYDCFFDNPIFRIAACADRVYNKSKGHNSTDTDATRSKEIENSSNRAFAVHSKYKLHELGIKAEYIKEKSGAVGKGKAKSSAVGDGEEAAVTVCDGIDEIINGNIDQLARLEHIRWSILYLVEGYRPLPRNIGGQAPDYGFISIILACKNADSAVQDADLEYETKNHMAKVHICLEDYDELDTVRNMIKDDVKSLDVIFCEEIYEMYINANMKLQLLKGTDNV